MDKSKPISVRLSNEEINTIEKFMKTYQIKSQNNFFRFSMAFTIGWMEFIMNAINDEKLNSQIEQQRQDIQAHLKKNPVANSNLQTIVKGHEKAVMLEINKKMNKAVEKITSFTIGRSAERPPNPKAGPGRPKEEGY